MLTQVEADRLMAMPKELATSSTIDFPRAGDLLQIQLKSTDGREEFLVDVNRKGRIKLTKCTYQERYAVVEILVRLDLDGPPHENPDGTVVPCPHLHIYSEGYADKWASALPPVFGKPSDLVKTLRDFLRFCKVDPIPPIQYAIS